jgi:hypothetical protein
MRQTPSASLRQATTGPGHGAVRAGQVSAAFDVVGVDCSDVQPARPVINSVPSSLTALIRPPRSDVRYGHASEASACRRRNARRRRVVRSRAQYMFISGVTGCGRSCAHATERPFPREDERHRARSGLHEECGPAGQGRRLGQLVAEPLDQVERPRQSSGSAISLRKTRCLHPFMSAFFDCQKTG